MDTDRPGREIDKEYRDIVTHLIDSQGWAYKLATGGGYPRLLPADQSQAPIRVPKTGHTRGRGSTTGSPRSAGQAVTGRPGGHSEGTTRTSTER
jgi:hypothetical protein